MQASSYTYQTLTKEYSNVYVQNEQLKNAVEQLKQVLEHSLYKDESKVKLCLNIISKVTTNGTSGSSA